MTDKLRKPCTSCPQGSPRTDKLIGASIQWDLRPQQRYRLVGIGLPGTATSIRMKSDQSAAAAPVGCCFIIASIPFFISFAVGSALCVPTIHV